MKKLIIPVIAGAGFCLLLSSCGTLGSDFLTALVDGMNGTSSALLSPYGNAYQTTNSAGNTNTQIRKADNNGGIYVGNKYVNLNAYGATTEGMYINSISAGAPVGGGYSTTSKSTSSSTSSSSSSRQCTICNGTGTVKRSLHVGGYGLDTSKKKCSTCGEMMMAPGHTHITCTNCKGTGVIK